jgi:hypothetical protein
VPQIRDASSFDRAALFLLIDNNARENHERTTIESSESHLDDPRRHFDLDTDLWTKKRSRGFASRPARTTSGEQKKAGARSSGRRPL